MRTNEEIINILNTARLEKNLSISELARRVKMAKSAVSRYFNLTREFPLNRVDDFSKVLSLEPEYVLGFDENENTDIVEIYNKLNANRQRVVYKFAETQLEEHNFLINDDDLTTETIKNNRKLNEIINFIYKNNVLEFYFKYDEKRKQELLSYAKKFNSITMSLKNKINSNKR